MRLLHGLLLLSLLFLPLCIGKPPSTAKKPPLPPKKPSPGKSSPPAGTKSLPPTKLPPPGTKSPPPGNKKPLPPGSKPPLPPGRKPLLPGGKNSPPPASKPLPSGGKSPPPGAGKSSPSPVSITPPTASGSQWKPIENVNESHVKEIADFAVAEYNKKNGGEYKLEKVVKGETQAAMPAGTNYRLVLEVSDEFLLGSEKYEAVVLEKPSQNSNLALTLISFEAMDE